jgi:hypothetical protein
MQYFINDLEISYEQLCYFCDKFWRNLDDEPAQLPASRKFVTKHLYVKTDSGRVLRLGIVNCIDEMKISVEKEIVTMEEENTFIEIDVVLDDLEEYMYNSVPKRFWQTKKALH